MMKCYMLLHLAVITMKLLLIYRNAWDDASSTSTADIKQAIANYAIHWISLAAAAATATIRRYIWTLLLNLTVVLRKCCLGP